MGYTTDFSGRFQLDKPLAPKMLNFLKLFSETRRMKRNVDEAFGIDGEFFVFGTGSYGQDQDDNIIDFNQQPSTQPSLWCQWVPTDDCTGIEWDGNEKFYSYNEWLFYLINKVLTPNGYTLNGVVKWQGEELGDVGKIVVIDNVITIQPWDESEYVMTAENVSVYQYPVGEVKNFMRTDVVLLLNEEETTGIENTQSLLV
jgi:hypothetical protein